MNTFDLLYELLYLDKDFISSCYEVETGEAATTHFTHQQGKKAGAAIPIFSAELSAIEIKSYNVSGLQMLRTLMPTLAGYPELDLSSVTGKKRTAYGWVRGHLSTAIARQTRTKSDETVVLAEEQYFMLIPTIGPSLDLITSESNFQSGLNALVRLQSTILKQFSLEARAFVRVLPSSTLTGHIVAIPLVILEGCGGT